MIKLLAPVAGLIAALAIPHAFVRLKPVKPPVLQQQHGPTVEIITARGGAAMTFALGFWFGAGCGALSASGVALLSNDWPIAGYAGAFVGFVLLVVGLWNDIRAHRNGGKESR